MLQSYRRSMMAVLRRRCKEEEARLAVRSEEA